MIFLCCLGDLLTDILPFMTEGHTEEKEHTNFVDMSVNILWTVLNRSPWWIYLIKLGVSLLR